MIPIQKAAENIGKYGCYLICLLHYVGIDESVLHYYYQFLHNKWIDEECTILQPLEIIHCLTGHTYRVVKSDIADPNATFSVYYWYNPRTKLHHFTMDGFDPLGDSKTRMEGSIESYRHYYQIM